MKIDQPPKSMDECAENICKKMFSIINNKTVIHAMIKDVIIPTLGSDADIEFWNLVIEKTNQ